MAIIGLVGLIGSGKGAVAQILTVNDKYSYWKKEAFANSVKDAVASIFGWDRAMLEGGTKQSREWRETDDLWWTKKLGKPFSPRLALQLMGTESGRNVFHRDLWVLSLLQRLDPKLNYVIADTRFPNEIDMIRDNGGKVVHVKRGEDPEWMAVAKTYNIMTNWDGSIQQMKQFPNIHYSEWAWAGKEFDLEINNSSTLHNLEKQVAKLVASVI